MQIPLLLLQISSEAEWLKLIVNLGSFGLVAWLVYYVFRTMLPKLAADFTSQLDAARKHHEDSMKSIIESHERIVRDQRVDFRSEIQQHRAEFKEELQRERAHFAQLLATLTNKREA